MAMHEERSVSTSQPLQVRHVMMLSIHQIACNPVRENGRVHFKCSMAKNLGHELVASIKLTCGDKVPRDLHDIRQPRAAPLFSFTIEGANWVSWKLTCDLIGKTDGINSGYESVKACQVREARIYSSWIRGTWIGMGYKAVFCKYREYLQKKPQTAEAK